MKNETSTLRKFKIQNDKMALIHTSYSNVKIDDSKIAKNGYKVAIEWL